VDFFLYSMNTSSQFRVICVEVLFTCRISLFQLFHWASERVHGIAE
jgi:hypothetical protein